MQIGYVGVGVRRASLFVRSPASLSLLWVRCTCDQEDCSGCEEDRSGRWVQRLPRIFRLSSSHSGLANVGNRSCRLNNFHMS